MLLFSIIYMSIKIFVTGGSFDKEYDPIQEKLLFTATILPEILKQARVTIPVDVQTLMMVDSLQMHLPDREMVVDSCKKTEEHKIIIIHGTSTMSDTARVLGEAKIKNKTIILTGAMMPYRLGNSDGLFNLGTAFGFVQTLKPGVYVSMNGRVFEWNNVKKNEKLGLFEEI